MKLFLGSNIALLASSQATDFSLTRTLADSVEYTILEETGTSTVWKIGVQSVFDEDLGYNNIQIEHRLTADIKSTDVVRFELNFISAGDPYTDRTVMAEDSAVCEVTIRASDTRFWDITTVDQLYSCSDNQCSSTTYTQTVDTTNDWVAWGEDDDADDPFCTEHSDTDNFACSAIKCRYERQMETGDS